ncbi:MAG TPA: hypothetical protein VF395_10710 [Polyangiaceae bacterium]
MITFAAMRRCFLHAAIGAALATSSLMACGGATFDGHVFRNDDLSFRVGGTPEGWHPIDAEGALLAFRDDQAPASIAVSGRCGKDGDDVPLEALTHHLFLQFTDRTVESQTRIQLDGREALRTELSAKLDGVPKRFTVYVLKKNSCVYDFAYVAPVTSGTAGQPRFEAFVQSFSTIQP